MATPTAPRAMMQRTAGDSAVPIPTPEQILKDAPKGLYTKLVLFKALNQYRDEHKHRAQSADNITEDRRGFLDGFAYLCDIKKGGATVTATALEKRPLSNFLWLAANERIGEDVRKYAETILSLLQHVNPDTQQAAQDDIFKLAIDQCKNRIELYKSEMQKYAKRCRMELRRQKRDDTGMIDFRTNRSMNRCLHMKWRCFGES